MELVLFSFLFPTEKIELQFIVFGYQESDVSLHPGGGGVTMKEDVTLSCPERYELFCTKDGDTEKCCCCCVSVVSPIRKTS